MTNRGRLVMNYVKLVSFCINCIIASTNITLSKKPDLYFQTPKKPAQNQNQPISLTKPHPLGLQSDSKDPFHFLKK